MNATRKIDFTKLTEIAKEIFSEQTGEELAAMKDNFGKAYNEEKIVAEIAAGMFKRISGLDEDSSRCLSPMDRLVEQGLQRLN